MPALKKRAVEQLERFSDFVQREVPKALRKLFRNGEGQFNPIVIQPVEVGGRKSFRFEGLTALSGGYYIKDGAEERT